MTRQELQESLIPWIDRMIRARIRESDNNKPELNLEARLEGLRNNLGSSRTILYGMLWHDFQIHNRITNPVLFDQVFRETFDERLDRPDVITPSVREAIETDIAEWKAYSLKWDAEMAHIRAKEKARKAGLKLEAEAKAEIEARAKAKAEAAEAERARWLKVVRQRRQPFPQREPTAGAAKRKVEADGNRPEPATGTIKKKRRNK